MQQDTTPEFILKGFSAVPDRWCASGDTRG